MTTYWPPAWLVAGGALAVAVCSAVIVAAVIRHARRLDIIDVPNERSSHATPTPRGGGVAIVLVAIGTLAVVAVFPGLDRLAVPALTLLLLGAPVAVISAVDDVRPLPATVRLVVHLAVGVAAWWWLGAFGTVELPALGAYALGVAAPVLTIVWVVGLVNAYNFMDGIDGLAAVQAIVAGLAWAAMGWYALSLPLLAIGGAVAASAAGFLWFNRPPARIFMGDVGSAFLGFVFAALPLVASHDSRSAVLGAAAVWPFVFDTSFTLVRRARRGENLLAAHRTHLYQRLVIAGWSHGHVVLLYGALAAFGAISGVCYARRLSLAGVVLALALPALALGLWCLTVSQERQRSLRDGRDASAGLSST